MLRLVHPAKQGKVSARPKGRRNPALTPSPEEQQRIRAALDHLRVAYGGYDVLAEVMGVTAISLAQGKCRPVSYALAVLLARAGNVPVEQILRPGLTDIRACSFCGRKGTR